MFDSMEAVIGIEQINKGFADISRHSPEYNGVSLISEINALAVRLLLGDDPSVRVVATSFSTQTSSRL